MATSSSLICSFGPKQSKVDVLVSAGIELIYLPVAAVVLTYDKYVNNEVFGVAMKSRTFFQSPTFS